MNNTKRAKINREHPIGFPVDIFVDPPSESFTCPICLQVVREPMQCSLGHVFCLDCISDALKTKDCCPVGKETLTQKQLAPNLIVKNLIFDLRVRCPSSPSPSEYAAATALISSMSASSDSTSSKSSKSVLSTTESTIPSMPHSLIPCPWVGKLSLLPTHLSSECPCHEVACSNASLGCNSQIQRRYLSNHLKDCEFEMECCSLPGCGLKVFRNELQTHENTCGCRVVNCPNECGLKGSPYQDLQTHLDCECPLQEVWCPFILFPLPNTQHKPNFSSLHTLSSSSSTSAPPSSTSVNISTQLSTPISSPRSRPHPHSQQPFPALSIGKSGQVRFGSTGLEKSDSSSQLDTTSPPPPIFVNSSALTNEVQDDIDLELLTQQQATEREREREFGEIRSEDEEQAELSDEEGDFSSVDSEDDGQRKKRPSDIMEESQWSTIPTIHSTRPISSHPYPSTLRCCSLCPGRLLRKDIPQHISNPEVMVQCLSSTIHTLRDHQSMLTASHNSIKRKDKALRKLKTTMVMQEKVIICQNRTINFLTVSMGEDKTLLPRVARLIGSGPGFHPGQLNKPCYFTIIKPTAHSWLLCVSEYGNGRVQMFNPVTGSFVRMIGSGGKGTGHSGLECPLGITAQTPCLGSGGRWLLYVSDIKKNRIQIYDGITGELVRSIQSTQSCPPILAPCGLRLLSMTDGIHEEHLLYVVNCNGHNILVFDAFTGKYVRTIGSSGTESGELLKPRDLVLQEPSPATSGRHLLYVSDGQNHRIQVFDALSGESIKTIGGGLGPAPGQLNSPRGLALLHIPAVSSPLKKPSSEQHGTSLLAPSAPPRPNQSLLSLEGTWLLFVADCGNHRVQVFNALTGTVLRNYGEGPSQSPGKLCCPKGIQLHPGTVQGTMLLFVSEYNNNRIQVFDV